MLTVLIEQSPAQAAEYGQYYEALRAQLGPYLEVVDDRVGGEASMESCDSISSKSESVREFVRALTEHLGPEAFVVVDHWDADPSAIGIGKPADPKVLVHVRVYDVAPRYFLSFERAAVGEWADHPYTPGEELSVDTLSEVLGLVKKHIA
ncbi:MAG: hypothetical protein WDO68_30115 [Gammaproteobacteria bacterium]